MLRRRRIGADVEGAPAREMGLGGPDLVTVDPEDVSVALGSAAQAGEIRAGFGLGHAQRPPFVTAQQRNQQPFDLSGGAELADARGGDVGTSDVGQLGRRLERTLEPDLHRIAQAQRSAAVLAGPGGLYPPGFEGGSLVVAAQRKIPSVLAIAFVVVVRQKLGQPGRELGDYLGSGLWAFLLRHAAPPTKREPTSR